jgi:hypothetical protein
MIDAHAITDRKFQAGDNVFLGEGPYQGTPGVFVKLLEDITWADVTERDGKVRRHPVTWLRHGDFVKSRSPVRSSESQPAKDFRA